MKEHLYTYKFMQLSAKPVAAAQFINSHRYGPASSGNVHVKHLKSHWGEGGCDVSDFDHDAEGQRCPV